MGVKEIALQRRREIKLAIYLLVLIAIVLAIGTVWHFIQEAERLGISLTPKIVMRSLKEVGRFIVLVIAGVAIVEGVLYGLLYRLLNLRKAFPYVLLAPAVLGVFFLIIYPFAYDVLLAFSNMSMTHFKNPTFSLHYGIRNFLDVFRAPVLQRITFFPLLGRTILWTVANVVCHVTGGMILALLLNRPMRLRGLYRTLLVIPWAMPQVIACLALKGEFHYHYGFVNLMLQRIGLQPIPWLRDPFWAFVAVCLSNIWLGIPFMMVIILGGLQSISQEFYEAAEIDGASWWQQFRNITLPMLRPVLTPAIILGVVWTFNNFNVIYLITGGGPMEGTDILVTALYKAVFEFYRYGFGAAFSLVIFAFLFLFAVIYVRLTGGLKGVYE